MSKYNALQQRACDKYFSRKAQTILHGFAVDLLADRLYSKSPASLQHIYSKSVVSPANLQQVYSKSVQYDLSLKA